VRHVSLPRDDLQPLNRLRIPDDIVEVDGPVFFDPVRLELASGRAWAS
jgi:hypothetical protein